MPWPLFYGALTLGTIWRAANYRQAPNDPLGAALILAALYIMTNVSHAAFRINDPYNRLYPACDALALFIMLASWRDSLSSWKIGLMLLLLTDLLLHVVYLGSAGASHRLRYAYDLALNIIFIGQLSCVVLGTVERG